MNLKYIFSFIFLLYITSTDIQGQLLNLLPKPQQIQYSSKQYLHTHSYAQAIQRINYIHDTIPNAPLHTIDEAYQLEVTTRHIRLTACSETGFYRGKQTLAQLADTTNGQCRIPVCHITDWPAFQVRGLMQDVGRSYISMDELKREIDLLSRFKINVFHWHLTENQAWRLESKRYPQLNAPQNMTRMPGKYYTLQEARELVDYCKQRHVMLIPEIDMPGHSEAFIRTFNTDMQSQQGMRILKDLLTEVCQTFDVPYLHIGTDEVTFTNPKFVPQMVAFIRAQGKKVISWNPGWNYRPGEIDMTQLWSYRGKAQAGIPAIDCRYHYLNHFDTYNDLVTLYNSRIYNQEQGSNEIAGAILAIWNDRYIPNERNNVAENNLYPAMLALAERSWLGGGTCYFDGKGTLLHPDTPQANQAFADFERRLLWHKKHLLKDEPITYVKQTQVVWRITDAFPNEGDLKRSFPPEQTDSQTYQYHGKTYNTQVVYGAGIYLRHVWGTLVPGVFQHPQENHTAYATTWVYSPHAQEAGLQLEFQNYSRSESDIPPRQGHWDYQYSKAWLNGIEITPPHWQSQHQTHSNEIALTNENMASRPPIPVHLQQGWNKLKLKLPVGNFTIPEIRLVKWMFTAVFVTPDGKDALSNIKYSAEIVQL